MGEKKTEMHFILRMGLAFLFIGIAFGAVIGIKILFKYLGIYDSVMGRCIFTALWIYLIYRGYGLYVRKIEKRETTEYAKPYFVKEMLLGMGLGAGLIALQICILWILGLYTVTGFVFSGGVLMMMFLSMITGFTEELINKGILFRILEGKLGSWLALGIVALEVGITHLTNAGATILSSFAVSLEFGLLLGLIFMLTRRLWVVTGFHFSWNFTMGVFGLNLSGLKTRGLFISRLDGPISLTGGEFGIEVGVIAMVIALIMSIIITVNIIRNKLYVEPVWRIK